MAAIVLERHRPLDQPTRALLLRDRPERTHHMNVVILAGFVEGVVELFEKDLTLRVSVVRAIDRDPSDPSTTSYFTYSS